MSTEQKPITTEFIVIEISACSFECLVRRVYGQEFCISTDQGIFGDSHKLFKQLTGRLRFHEIKNIVRFTETGKYNYLSKYLLEDLIRKGELPAGNILVDCT